MHVSSTGPGPHIGNVVPLHEVSLFLIFCKRPFFIWMSLAKRETRCEVGVCGCTVRARLPSMPKGLPILVLVVGCDVSSHLWLHILPLSTSARLRYYITEEDMQFFYNKLHVRPTVVPSFLVCLDGFFIDWFPAPLPNMHREPTFSNLSLLTEVEKLLDLYGKP